MNAAETVLGMDGVIGAANGQYQTGSTRPQLLANGKGDGG